MNDKPPPVPALEYDPTASGYVSRGRYRTVVVVAVAAVALLVCLLVPFAWYMAARPMQVRVVAPPAATPAPPPVVQRAVTTITTAPPAMSEYEIERRERVHARGQYMSYTAPADHVVYEEDPVAARRLLRPGSGDYRGASRRSIEHPWGDAFQPPVFETNPAGLPSVRPFREPNDGERDRCVLFVHALTSPGGNERLVYLDLSVAAAGSRTKPGKSAAETEYKIDVKRKFGYRIFDAPASTDWPTQVRDGASLTIVTPEADTFPIRWIDGVLRSDRRPGKSLRFFAGQTDPKDASHFTVPYEYDGRRGTIDGWLTDDDFLRIRPSGGRVEGGTWHVGGEEATPAAGSGDAGATPRE